MKNLSINRALFLPGYVRTVWAHVASLRQFNAGSVVTREIALFATAEQQCPGVSWNQKKTSRNPIRLGDRFKILFQIKIVSGVNQKSVPWKLLQRLRKIVLNFSGIKGLFLINGIQIGFSVKKVCNVLKPRKFFFFRFLVFEIWWILYSKYKEN